MKIGIAVNRELLAASGGCQGGQYNMSTASV